MIALTRKTGQSFFNLTRRSERGDNTHQYFVRPSGSIYGNSDGNSYENAWSGFANIDWDSISDGSTLYICGTHNEALTIGKSNIIISGGYVEESGLIDCQNLLNSGIIVTDKTNVVINNLTSLRAVVNGILIQGNSEVITNDCEFSETGNQGIQHLGNAKGTHNNAICNDNVDDGISGHDDAIIIVNGGQFKRNESGINVVHSVNLTISSNPVFLNNTLNDIWATNATTTGSCVANISDCNFTGNVDCQAGAIINMNDSTVAGTFTNDSIVNATKSVIANMSHGTSPNESTFNECVILASNRPPGAAVVNYHKSRIFGSIRINGKVTATHCIFDATGGTDMTLDVLSGGSLNVNYSIFKNIVASKFGVAARTGAVEVIVNNCNFIGNNNIGRGTFSQVDIEINNCIYTGLETGHQRTAGVSTLNNCSFFDNSTDKAGTITSNNEVTGDPLFADVENEDYTLLEGSPCIDTGLDTGFPEGIDTANWGDLETTPVVSTKLQGENYDIGAYVK